MFKLAGLLIFLVIFFISYKLDNNKPPAKYHIPEGKKNGGKVPQGTGTVPAEKEKAAGGFDRQGRISPGAEMTAEVQRYLARVNAHQEKTAEMPSRLPESPREPQAERKAVDWRQAMIMSEILQPPLAKRKRR